jgi:hypothetical protein
MAYYPESGDTAAWFAWYFVHNPGCTDDEATAGLLKIFESEVWCQRSKVQVLRRRRDPAYKVEAAKLQHMVAFLMGNSPQHRSFEFKQYRENLRRGRFVYATFNSIPTDYPYDELMMELVRCEQS